MVRIVERLRHECSQSPRQGQCGWDALSCMNMGSVSHVYEAKKDLVRDVHRLAKLGVRLEGSSNGGVIVHHNSESSLVVEVKSKKHLDEPLMELKESVLDKLNESFSLGGMVC